MQVAWMWTLSFIVVSLGVASPALGNAHIPERSAVIMPASDDPETLKAEHAEAERAVFESLSALSFAVTSAGDVERNIRQLEASIRNCRTEGACMREVAELMGTDYAVAVIVWPKEGSRTPSRVAVYIVAAHSDAEADSDQLVQAAGVAYAANQAAAQAWGRLAAIQKASKDSPKSEATPAASIDHAKQLKTKSPSILGPVILGSAGLALTAGTGVAAAILSGSCAEEDPSGACVKEYDVNWGPLLAFMGAGVLAIGGAVLWYLLSQPDSEQASSQHAAAVSVEPIPGGLSLKGTF